METNASDTTMFKRTRLHPPFGFYCMTTEYNNRASGKPVHTKHCELLKAFLRSSHTYIKPSSSEGKREVEFYIL